MTTTPELFTTATGQRLHLEECPHVHGVELFPADDRHLDVCAWCDAEIRGYGRTHHASIEDALLDMGAAQHAVPELARHLRSVVHDSVFVPFSRAYVALARDGRTVAAAGCSYVDLLDGPTKVRVELPGYVPVQRSGGNEVRDAWGTRCDGCFLLRSRDGSCDCG